MTDRRRHSQPPLRRSTTPERILSAGLATATCIGVVGLLGVRTIEANAASTTDTAAVDTATVDLAVSTPSADAPATSSTGLTEEQLDAYAAELAKEKDRLDAYRAELVKTAKKLKKQAAALRQGTSVATGSSAGISASPSRPTTTAQAPRPAAKPKPAPAAKPKPAPAAKPAPQPAPAPAPKPAPQAQSNTKGS